MFHIYNDSASYAANDFTLFQSYGLLPTEYANAVTMIDLLLP